MGTSASLPGGKDLKHNRSIYVDAVYGSASGEMDNESKAFDTIQGAMSVLAALGTGEYNMHVAPGAPEYDELVDCATATNKTINLIMAPGVTHQYTGADPNALYNNAGAGAGAVSLNVYGYGNFNRLGTNPTDANAFFDTGVVNNIYGFLTINASQDVAVDIIGKIYGHGKETSTVSSSASHAINRNASTDCKDLTAFSSATTAIATGNGVFTMERCIVESSVVGAVGGPLQFSGGVASKDCDFIGTTGIAVSVFGFWIQNGGSIVNNYDNAAGHCLVLSHAAAGWRTELKDVKLICANASANSIGPGANATRAYIYSGVFATNSVATSQPAIVTLTPAGAINPGDIFTITKTSSTDFINYTAIGGDGVVEVLAGLKLAWLAKVGTGDEFDNWLQNNAANAYLLDDSSGTELVVTSASGAYFSMAAGVFTASVVGGGATFVDAQNQAASGVINQISGTNIIVDPNVI